MKHIPILFSTAMVQAILDGRKTQTRRIMKPQPSENVRWDSFGISALTPKRHIEGRGFFTEGYGSKFFKCPYGQPGDILWVRETWTKIRIATGEQFIYRADDDFYKDYVEEWHGWRPSIHMPKEACRIFLKVKSIRVERLQDISEEDAKHEGVLKASCCHSFFHGFSILWQSINGPASWEANPWVWVVEFERCERPENFTL